MICNLQFRLDLLQVAQVLVSNRNGHLAKPQVMEVLICPSLYKHNTGVSFVKGLFPSKTVSNCISVDTKVLMSFMM